MSELGCESRILGPSSQGKILEIAFRGTHELRHGWEMDHYIRKKLADHRPAAIVFNLLDYQYVFGNDVTGLFTASIDRDAKGFQMRPVCIVATGTTYTSLYNLFKSAKIIDALGIEFVSTVESALQRLTEKLGLGGRSV